MTDETPSPPVSPLLAWAQLVRLPNVFTVIADVSAAYLLVGGGPHPLSRLLSIVVAGISLYWAGMILNDLFDLPRDREERPERPLPAGLISVGSASAAGWGLLAIGVGIAATAGYLPGADSTNAPLLVALLLAVMIVAYDGPLKKTVLAPGAMGCCRILSFLLGASPLVVFGAERFLFPEFVLAGACGFGIYVMGITTMARNEATGGSSSQLHQGIPVHDHWRSRLGVWSP